MAFQSGIAARTSDGRYAALSMNVPFYLAAFLMVAALVLGGGGGRNGYLSDAILQMLSIPVLIFSLWRLSTENLPSQIKWALVFCLAVIAVPLLQLIPLPPDIWMKLPGRNIIVSTLEVAGLKVGWMPLSMSPGATWLSLAAMLPPLSIFLITLLLSNHDRQRLTLVIIATGLLSVFIGLLQVTQGSDSPLRFYGPGTDAEGFFANRNHFAALIYCLIVLVSAWIWIETGNFSSRSAKSGQGMNPTLKLLLGFTLIIILIGAALMARSRTGIALTIVALLAGYLLPLGLRKKSHDIQGTKIRRLVMGAILLFFIFSTQFALYRTLDRFSHGIGMHDGERISFAQKTAGAAWSFMPLGSGLGTFVPVYKLSERLEGVLVDRYVNRAHNDFLEFWLETGGLAIVFIIIFYIFFVTKIFSVWRLSGQDKTKKEQVIMRTVIIVITLLSLHSLVDYSFHTSAMAGILLFFCAVLVTACPREKSI